MDHFAFLRIALRETLTHLGGEVDNPIKLTQNNLPGFGTGADEALVINLQSRKYHLIEKRIKYNGAFLNYFSENQKTNDLVFIQFSKEGVDHFAFLRIALRETLIHLGGEVDNPIKLTQNNLPGFGTGADEALVINLQSRKYYLIEKRIKYNGTFLNYFSDALLQVAPKISPKKSIKEIEKTANRIAENFNQDDFQFQSKVKSAIFNQLEEKNELSPEELANDLFDSNLTARLSFVDQVKEAIPEPVRFDEIDASRQLKKFENQKLSLSNGIELLVPNHVYEDAESVEFIQNDNGTYSILIKNIEDIQSK